MDARTDSSNGRPPKEPGQKAARLPLVMQQFQWPCEKGIWASHNSESLSGPYKTRPAVIVHCASLETLQYRRGRKCRIRVVSHRSRVISKTQKFIETWGKSRGESHEEAAEDHVRNLETMTGIFWGSEQKYLRQFQRETLILMERRLKKVKGSKKSNDKWTKLWRRVHEGLSKLRELDAGISATGPDEGREMAVRKRNSCK